LTVNDSGTTTFAAAVGGGTALASLTTGAGGTTAINGGTVTTSGAQTYADSVTLGAATTLTSTGSSVSMLGTVNGANTLAVNAATTATLSGGVGLATPLTSLTATAPAIILGNVTTNGPQLYNGNVTFNSAYITNGGSFTINGTTTLGSSSSITTGAGAVTLNGAVNADADPTVEILTINGGTVLIIGPIGNLGGFGGLLINSSGATTLNGNLTSVGTVSLTAGGALTFADINAVGQVVNLSGNSLTETGVGNNIDAATGRLFSNTNVLTGNNILANYTGQLVVGGATTWQFLANSTANPFALDAPDVGRITISVGGQIIAASLSSTTAALATSAAQASATAAAADEAANTFGTDSVAEQVEYGFAGDVGTLPPMDHRLQGVGIAVPKCFNESREGENC
jgi:hypothetical protein